MFALAVLCWASAPLPATMRQVRTSSLLGCKKPFAKCVSLATVPLPALTAGQVLVRVEGSSVNPSDVDTVELGGCGKGCGNDFAGTVVACPSGGCGGRLKVGDAVWGNSEPAFSDYVAAAADHTALKPADAFADFAAAATLPEVGLTSLFGLKRTVGSPSDPMPPGNPWEPGRYANLTVVITSGGGGTGSLAIEISKAWGAKNIVTAASGAAGIAFVKRLGATAVVDYKTTDIFDVLADDSVDIVFDNYGGDGTPAKAMKVLRSGGSYLLIPHGACYLSKAQSYPCLALEPKKGVSQLNYNTEPDYAKYSVQGLDELKALVETAQVTPTIDRSFPLNESAAAFNYSAGPGGGGVGDHIGKISLVV